MSIETDPYRDKYLIARNWMRDNRVREHPFFETLLARQLEPLRQYRFIMPAIRAGEHEKLLRLKMLHDYEAAERIRMRIK